MRILPIINADFDNRTGFKNNAVKGSKALLQTLPEAPKAAKVGALLVLAYVGAGSTKEAAGNETDNFQIKELTKEQFKTMKAEILSHKKDFKAFKGIDTNRINEWNVQLFDYMLQHPEEYNDDKYCELVSGITNEYSPWEHVENENQAEVALRMLKMPWAFRDNEYFRECGIGEIANSVENPKQKNIKLAMLNKLDEYKNTYTLSGPQEVAIVEMLQNINTDNGLKVALKILENPDILDSNDRFKRGFSEDCFKSFSNERKYADIKLAVIEKINSNPELFETKYFKHAIAGILNNTVEKETKEFVLKVLEMPQLFNSKSFAENLGNIIYEFPQGKNAKNRQERAVILDILEAIKEANKKYPKMFENEEFLDDLGRLVFIQKLDDDTILWSHDKLMKIAKKNMYLIKSGYYNTTEEKK